MMFHCYASSCPFFKMFGSRQPSKYKNMSVAYWSLHLANSKNVKIIYTI